MQLYFVSSFSAVLCRLSVKILDQRRLGCPAAFPACSRDDPKRAPVQPCPQATATLPRRISFVKNFDSTLSPIPPRNGNQDQPFRADRCGECCARLPTVTSFAYLHAPGLGRIAEVERAGSREFASRKSGAFRKRILPSYTSTPLAPQAPAVSGFTELASRASSFNPAKRDLSYKGSGAPARSASISRLGFSSSFTSR